MNSERPDATVPAVVPDAEPRAADARGPSDAPLVDLGGRSPWSILPPLCLGFFVIMVDTTIVNIAVPTLVATFETSLTAVGWVNSAYLLAFAVLLLVTGRLGDRFGAKPVFISGLALFMAASFACGLAGSIETLIIGRAVQGVGSALMTPQTMAMITRVFPPARRGAALGLWGATAGVATIAGPVLGGIFVETIGWEWIFFVNIPIGVVALWLAVRNLPRLDTHTRRFDLLGVVLSVVGLFLMIFGLQEGETFGWGQIAGPLTVWRVIGAGVLITAAFLLWQKRQGADALLPLTLFTHRNFALANVSGAVASFAMIGIFFPLTLFLQQVLGLSPLAAAMVNLPGSLVSGLVAPFAGRLSDRVPGKWVVGAGFAFLTGAVVWLTLVVDAGAAAWVFYPPMTLFGVGTGLLFSPLANLATSGLDRTTAGAGAGAFNMNRQVGGVIGSAAIVAMLTSRLGVEVPAAAADAAAQLPADVRGPFLEAFASSHGGEFSGGGAGQLVLPDSIPADVADQVREAALAAIHSGFGVAVGQTLLLTAAVLATGLISSLAMSRTSR